VHSKIIFKIKLAPSGIVIPIAIGKSNKLIPETTDRKTCSLIVAVLAFTATVIGQAEVPGAVGIALRRTPQDTVDTNIVEITINEAGAARES
jgi:hypothetical protein